MIRIVIFWCYFSSEHIALTYKKWCEHGIRTDQQIKSTSHDANRTEINKLCVNKPRQSNKKSIRKNQWQKMHYANKQH